MAPTASVLPSFAARCSGVSRDMMARKSTAALLSQSSTTTAPVQKKS